MPFAVEKRGKKWVTVTKRTGKVHGEHDSQGAAMAQMRAMYAAGADETKKKRKKKRGDSEEGEFVKDDERRER